MKPFENIKAIVVDLDRTLLRTDKTLSAYTVAVFRECKARGIKIMVATARPWRTAKAYCETLDVDAVVVSNGARVICGDRTVEYGIPQTCAEDLLTALKRQELLRITLETGDQAYSNLPVADYETILTENLEMIARTEGVLKLLVHLDSPDTQGIVEKELTEGLYATVANGYLLQIMSKAATKWNGIQAMLRACACSPEEAAYFGDDQDDIEPIKMCGLGVAVANGIEAVKAVADLVAQSNDADGVAQVIAEHILN